MLNEFANALISTKKSSKIPDDQNIFGSVIGNWDFEWVDDQGTAEERRVKGEWLFSWILEGTAIQDLFICPSREERIKHKQPDAEYGTTIRIYNPKKRVWDVFYGCTGETTRLEAQRQGDKIVLMEINAHKMKWIFSDITENSFHWQKMIIQDRSKWQLAGELFATRKRV